MFNEFQHGDRDISIAFFLGILYGPGILILYYPKPEPNPNPKLTPSEQAVGNPNTRPIHITSLHADPCIAQFHLKLPFTA